MRGLRLCLSVTNFLVVRTSHTGSSVQGLTSGDVESTARRFLVAEKRSFFWASLIIYLRSALDALRVFLN